MKIYIAGPLFSSGEKEFNIKVDALIRSIGFETYLPQRDGGLVADMPDLVDGVPKEEYVFRMDIMNLKSADIFLILMDGRVPDEGACTALGFCYANGIRCIGYQTDVRRVYAGKNNLMLSGMLETVLHNENELRAFLEGIAQ